MYDVKLSKPYLNDAKYEKKIRELEKKLPCVYRVVMIHVRNVVMYSVRRPKFRKDIAEQFENDDNELFL